MLRSSGLLDARVHWHDAPRKPLSAWMACWATRGVVDRTCWQKHAEGVEGHEPALRPTHDHACDGMPSVERSSAIIHTIVELQPLERLVHGAKTLLCSSQCQHHAPAHQHNRMLRYGPLERTWVDPKPTPSAARLWFPWPLATVRHQAVGMFPPGSVLEMPKPGAAAPFSLGHELRPIRVRKVGGGREGGWQSLPGRIHYSVCMLAAIVRGGSGAMMRPHSLSASCHIDEHIPLIS